MTAEHPEWLQRALAWPDLRAEYEDWEPGAFTPFQAFFELESMLGRALAAGDDAAIDAYFAFAAWAFAHRESDIKNAAGLGFYKSLVDRDPALWPSLLARMEATTIAAMLPLWERRLDDQNKLQLLRELTR